MTKTKTICLNMIVKNESKNILNCIENILKYIKIDYWVICDTGSTDGTEEIILSKFQKENIDGELHSCEWIDFGVNRTEALNKAYNKSDYILLFDADDIITGNFTLPEASEFNSDQYNLKLRNGNCDYYRPLIISNRIKWKFEGVLHEYLDSDTEITKESLKGDYCVLTGTHGCRNQDENKYANDAKTLCAEFENLNNSYSLRCRYAYYCANSYKDAGENESAIIWYKKVVEKLDNWSQEKYNACYNLGKLYEEKEEYEQACHYWFKSLQIDFERFESIISLMKYFYSCQNFYMINTLYHKFIQVKNQTNNFENIKKETKLFSKYDNLYMIYYYNSIAAYYVEDYESGIISCQYLLDNNYYYNLSQDNIQYYITKIYTKH